MVRRAWFAGCFLGAVVSLLVSVPCFGAGFAITEGSARGTALGEAMVGRADDPSAIFYNPAGITQLPGVQMISGLTMINLNTDVSTRFGTQTTNDWGFPPHAYLTYQTCDRIWLGLGVFTPFGLKVAFPQDWFGAFNSYEANVQSFTINPNVALKLTDQLSVAAGFEAMYMRNTLKQLIPVTVPGIGQLPTQLSPSLDLVGSSWGYGFNLAAHYKPCQFVSMGVSYRSEIRETATLGASFVSPTPLITSINSNARSSLTLPDSVAFGVTFYPTKRLSWEVGGVWTDWSDFKQLQFSFQQPFAVPGTVTIPKDWHDTWRFQTGVEYKACPWLDLRAGYIYDQEAINTQFADYELPAGGTRQYLSVGPGFHFCEKFTLDLAYSYVFVSDRTVTNSLSPGYINPTSLTGGHAQLIGIDIGYKF